MLQGVNLTVRAGRRRLLHHVDVEVRPGEVTGLLGASGAGKSTLLRVLAGDVLPAEGIVRMDARPLYLWSISERVRTRAAVLQDHAVPRACTVLDAVLLGRRPHAPGRSAAEEEQIAREALAVVAADTLAGRQASTLSGGERALVLLAQALAQVWPRGQAESRYLLLDEPVATPAPSRMRHVLAVLRDVARRSAVGVCVVLHDPALAAQHADRVLLLGNGQTLAHGAPRDVLTDGAVGECLGARTRTVASPRRDAPPFAAVA